MLETLTIGGLASVILRGFFTFGLLMKWGQALLALQKEGKIWHIVKPLSLLWAICMIVSAVTDVIINVTLMSLIFWERPSAWNETLSYRVGRYVYSGNYDTDWRKQLALPVCKVLTFLEGEEHCAYIYGVKPCPYPDLKVLF